MGERLALLSATFLLCLYPVLLGEQMFVLFTSRGRGCQDSTVYSTYVRLCSRPLPSKDWHCNRVRAFIWPILKMRMGK